MSKPTVALEIPIDLVDSVISALYRSADSYRADKAHAAADIVLLMADADRLEALAEKLQDDYASYEKPSSVHHNSIPSCIESQ